MSYRSIAHAGTGRIDRTGAVSRADPAPDGRIRTLVDLLGRSRDFDAAPFLSYIDDLSLPPVESVTYRQFFARATSLADTLRGRGIRAGDRVALIALPRVDYTVALAGTVLAGAVAAPVNHHFKARELAAYLDLLDPAMIVVDHHTASVVDQALNALPSGRPSVAGICGYEQGDLVFTEPSCETTGHELVTVTPDSPAIVLHSSGTTGLPKAVVRTHGAIAEFLNWFAQYFDDDEHILNFLPLYHQAGLILSVLTASRLGVDLVQQSRYSTSAFWDLVDTYGATHMNLVAPVPSYLLSQPPRSDDRDHSLRWTVIAGRNDHWAAFQDRFGVVGMTMYGSTETLQITSTGSPKRGPYPGGVLEKVTPGMMTGPAIQDVAEYRIVDGAGALVTQPDVQGRIEVRGRFAFTEYLHAPELTAAAFTPDGWFVTGDIGYSTVAGELVLIGRESGMIRRSGENIAAREIELLLEDHPAVDEVIVIGIPDQFRGQDILAAIAPTPGVTLTADEVFEYLEQTLSSFKVPRYIAFQDEFEHTPTFKIKREQVAFDRSRTHWHERRTRS